MVDDQPESVEPLAQELLKERGTQVEIVTFGNFQKSVEAFAPNMIVLDLVQGNIAEHDIPGFEAFDEIWQKRFCPLVVYTAVPELFEGNERLPHPFIAVQKKGAGSVARVIDKIREFGPHLSALDEAGREISSALNRALRDVAPRIFKEVAEEKQQKEMLVRSARRQVAAAMDKELSTGGPNLRSWEHYLCPPVTTEHLLTGDVLVKRGADRSDPSQYGLVITPSCDLVRSEGRPPKVKKILVASCTNVQRLLEDLNVAVGTKWEKYKEKLLSMLRQGHGNSCMPLPGLPGQFPAMAADFRKLDLVDIGEVGGEKATYERVASVDNPFRELVAWAYSMNATRPGLPDRDFESWANEVGAALSKLGEHK
jgi:hypothetical protein